MPQTNSNMKKIITLVVALMAFSATTFAQEKILSLQYSMATPSGNTASFTDASSFRGGTLEYRHFINPSMSVGFSLGYQKFYKYQGYNTVELPGGDGHISGQEYNYIDQFPIMATYHYYFGEQGGIRPYIGGGIGAAHYEYTNQMGSMAYVGKQWHMQIAPEVGVLFPIGHSVYLHTNVKYNYAFEAGNYSAQQYWGFNVGLAFDL